MHISRAHGAFLNFRVDSALIRFHSAHNKMECGNKTSTSRLNMWINFLCMRTIIGHMVVLSFGWTKEIMSQTRRSKSSGKGERVDVVNIKKWSKARAKLVY